VPDPSGADVSERAIPAAFARIVRSRAGHACEYCQLLQATQEATFHVDHIRPRAAGGRTAIANLALACVGCSLRKGARWTGFDTITGKSVALFNPRRDPWTDHFEWTRSWRLKGRTARGRATVAALGMNRPSLIGIRRELARLRKFPPLFVRGEGN
jgi:hypothetical protein